MVLVFFLTNLLPGIWIVARIDEELLEYIARANGVNFFL